ncbi:interferon-inducible GTPase 1-like isoform X2 [Dreissena polymorpha]|uniref:interferon-inducible GTPase 1-like isoform X2 n=1 Tax=Dreissena polymorpha TaxID=45954 RepID=UPI002264144F|nr:interferon-inducible GTPase 1-like isoform X2 [Dreissena polymorpha]
MASKSETIDIRCPSCKEEVKSTWKCCPHCETRLERLSCKPSTTSNLTERPHSLTDIIKVDPLHSDSIGPACIETPLTERQPLVNADNDIVSDCVDDPIQDAENAVGSDLVNNPEQDAGDVKIAVEEYLRDFEEAVQKGGVANLSDFITDDLNKWQKSQINIAIIGESGTGKSSFINTIRGLQRGDEFYATIGSSETTTTIQQYPHPAHHNLVFWDLPGVGTPRFPKESYLRVIDVKKYDFFILVSATRFKENDAWLAKEICHLEKKFYFVKSKIDFDVENDLQEYCGMTTKADIIDKIRKEAATELKKTGLKLPKLFLVNNKNINEYDFKDLITQLLNDAPVLQKHTLILSMSSLARTILDEKRRLLDGRRLKVALIASMGDSPGIVVLVNETKFYQKQFGISDKSLKTIADRINMSFDDIVKKLHIVSTSIFQSANLYMNFFRKCEKEWNETDRVSILSGVLPILPASRYGMFVLRKILDMCYSEALRILSLQNDILSGKI